MSEHLLPEWQTEENLAIARAMRGGEDDQSYADIAEHFGLPRSQWKLVKDALDAAPAPAPAPKGQSRLEALAARAAAMKQSEDDDGITAEVRMARRDAPLTEAEAEQVIDIFRNAWPTISYEEMGEALEPPRHWLTVTRALSERGWVAPNLKVLPYCTSTPEGQERLAREHAAGLVDPAIWAREYINPATEGSLA